MGETTLTITDGTKDRLEDHRHDEHDSWSETLDGMMEMLPSIESFNEGCRNCEEEPFMDVPPEEYGGVVRWFKTEVEGNDVFGMNYYCSPECANEVAEEMEKYVPENPDEVVVGGLSELRTSVYGASFYLDRDRMEVGVPVPGAFGGESSHGTEYDYIGEPVYVYHDGDFRHTGVIEEIIHEEAHTALLLGRNIEVEMLNHPDDERREEYEEQHAKWTEAECASCGSELRFMVEEPPEECPECEAAEW